MNNSLTYEVVSVSSIKAFAGNPRHHSKNQVRRIADSIRQYGLTNPPLVDEANVLIAGHGRLAAAELLGLQEVPIIRVTGLNENQKRALRIADNRIAERSTWSKDLLVNELKHLVEMEFDVELTGFDTIEIDNLLTIDSGSAEDEPDIAPPPANPATRTGDLWALGSSFTLCGDARDPSSYASLLGNSRADMVITDVPYNVPILGHVSGSARHGEFAMASGEMSADQFLHFLRVVLQAARDVSRDGSLHYVFIDWRSVGQLIGLGGELYTELKNLICWVKPNPAWAASTARSMS